MRTKKSMVHLYLWAIATPISQTMHGNKFENMFVCQRERECECVSEEREREVCVSLCVSVYVWMDGWIC